MKKNNITIKEIAQKSGVSVSTVSRVLNNHPSVSPAKRARVQKIIDQEGFHPSMLARGMVSKRTQTIAVVVSDITNPYFTSLVLEIELASQDKGYSMLLFNTMTAGRKKKEDASRYEMDTFHTIIEKNVDGVLILGGEIDKDHPNADYLAALNQLNNKVPVLIVGQKQIDCQCTFIERNLDKGVFLAVQHLLALQNKKIGFIGGEPGVKITSQRVQAFKDVLHLYGKFDPSLIYLSDFYTEDGYSSMNNMINDQIKLPDALIAINDRVAVGAIRALKEANLSCPEDIAIVSCDAFPDGEYQNPSLTTINQHNNILGKLAINNLINLIKEQPVETVQLHSPDLIIRESCGIQLRKTGDA